MCTSKLRNLLFWQDKTARTVVDRPSKYVLRIVQTKHRHGDPWDIFGLANPRGCGQDGLRLSIFTSTEYFSSVNVFYVSENVFAHMSYFYIDLFCRLLASKLLADSFVIDI